MSQAVAVLCDAFHEYPVMQYVIGAVDGDYDRHLHTLINFFVMARVWRGEPILAVSNGSDLVATAILTLRTCSLGNRTSDSVLCRDGA